MNRLSKLIISIGVVVMCAGFNTVSGQTKKETKAYNKAMKLGTIEAFEAFTSKFPSSVYVAKVNALIDSMHFSRVDVDDIKSCLAFMNQYPDSKYYNELELSVFKMAVDQRYIQDNTLTSFSMLKNFEPMDYLGNSYYYFVYVNYLPKADMENPVGVRCEYVLNMLDKKSGAVHSSMFSGKIIGKDGKYLLEGDFMDDMNTAAYLLPESAYLLSQLKEETFLLPISEGDVMTDQAIEWWLKNNPPQTKRLKFGLLPEESTIVELFKKEKEFENGGGYKVAFFDVRGYTVVTAYQKSSNQYILVWAEPICKDTKKDPFLNTLYFENANSLVLYYYKGRTTYKVRVNMANKTISR